MTTPSGASKKSDTAGLPGELQGIDRLFGRDIRSLGWAVDLTRITRGGSGRDALQNRVDESPDPAMIWVLRGRRR